MKDRVYEHLLKNRLSRDGSIYFIYEVPKVI